MGHMYDLCVYTCVYVLHLQKWMSYETLGNLIRVLSLPKPLVQGASGYPYFTFLATSINKQHGHRIVRVSKDKKKKVVGGHSRIGFGQ